MNVNPPTQRQLEVLKAIWTTGSLKHASMSLGIGQATVDSHTRSLRKRLGRETIIDMLRWGVRAGVLAILLFITTTSPAKRRPPPQPVTTNALVYWLPVQGAVSYDVVCGGRTNLTFGTNELLTQLAIGLTYSVYVQAVGSSGVRSSPSCPVFFVAGKSGTNICATINTTGQ